MDSKEIKKSNAEMTAYEKRLLQAEAATKRLDTSTRALTNDFCIFSVLSAVS